jgi:hypothetical protein
LSLRSEQKGIACDANADSRLREYERTDLVHLVSVQSKQRRNPMFHKVAISLVAAMTLGAASIATPASAAHGGFSGGGGRGAFRGGGFAGRGFGGFERRGFGDFGRGFGYFGGYPYGYPYYPYAPYYPYYYSPYGG